MILVIADDFSGAAEVAGVAHQFGLTAEVQTDRLRDSDCDVVVVDTNTRHLQPELAATAMQRLAPSIRKANPGLLFKKVDSVLRGPVLAELTSLASALGLSSCLLVNANPRKGRFVRTGNLLVDEKPIDQTEFAKDPEHPRTSASVTALLGSRTDQVRLIDSAEQFADADSHAAIHVANVESSDDLLQYASLRDGHCLLAGGAEYFSSLLAAELGHAEQEQMTPLQLEANTLIVRGTSRRRHPDEFPAESFPLINCANRGADASANAICKELSNRGWTVISTELTHQDPKSDPSTLVTGNFHRQLVEVVAIVLGCCKLQHLWIEGGRTASHLVRARGWNRLKVGQVYADGVVGVFTNDPLAPTIVVKPGSYQWPVSKSGHAIPSPVEVQR